jgi:hypothetical protein
MVRELKDGGLDLFIGLSTNRPRDARHAWLQDVV